MAVTDGQTARERLREELAVALAACDDPELRRQLQATDGMVTQPPPTPLVECPDRGVVGLPERIAVHDCPVKR
jgi:hypothetical protein